jgi:formate dehydrogenase maturation protein FdhE
MLDNVHVIIRKKDQINFWEQELYGNSDFHEACLDVSLLLKEGICREVERDDERMGNEQEIQTEYCPFCGKNLIRVLSEQEQKKYNLRYVSDKIGISNWDSVFAWKCPYCAKMWRREC